MSGKQFSPPVKRFYGKKTEDILDFIYISFLLIYFVNDLPPDLEVVDFCRDHLILTMANKGFSVDITNNISYYIHLFIKAKTFLVLAMDQKLQKHRKNSGGISLMGVN